MEETMDGSNLFSKVNQRVSRRHLLRGASAGIAASMTGSFLPAWGLATQARKSSLNLTIHKPSPASLPKAWSSAEFRRRWQMVRERMKESHLDCLIVPQHITQAMIRDRQDGDADVQYLVGIPAGWVIFPIEGKITAVSSRIENLLAEKKPLSGIVLTTLFAENAPDIEVRFTREEGLWSPTIIDVLRERKMEQGRIGVGSIADMFRNTEGSVTYTTYDRVRKAFPQAQFESAVDLLWQVKLVNSAEEIAVLENVAAVSEAGLQAMVETARPGAIHRDVWLSMYREMVECSGERPWRLSISARGGGNASFGFPMEETFDAGQVMSQECSGAVLGYGAQVNHSVLIGSEGPADWPAAAQYCIDLFHSLLDQIAPGKSIKEVCDFCGQRMQARGARPGGVLIHSSGLGDLPRSGPGRSEGRNDSVFQTGMVFDLKPTIPIKQTHMVAQFGDPILVTEKGARRLGKRKMEIITLRA
jgi:Xaa-Pro aminopeptidase